HRQRAWSEERSQRGDDTDVVTGLDAESQLARRRDREPQLDLAALELARELEAGVGEHAGGVRIAGADDGHEFGDAGGPGANRELLEQPRPDAAPLLAVGDDERDLRRVSAVEALVVGESDDLALEVADQRPVREPVGIQVGLDEALLDTANPVEAQRQ